MSQYTFSIYYLDSTERENEYDAAELRGIDIEHAHPEDIPPGYETCKRHTEGFVYHKIKQLKGTYTKFGAAKRAIIANEWYQDGGMPDNEYTLEVKQNGKVILMLDIYADDCNTYSGICFDRVPFAIVSENGTEYVNQSVDTVIEWSKLNVTHTHTVTL